MVHRVFQHPTVKKEIIEGLKRLFISFRIVDAKYLSFYVEYIVASLYSTSSHTSTSSVNWRQDMPTSHVIPIERKICQPVSHPRFIRKMDFIVKWPTWIYWVVLSKLSSYLRLGWVSQMVCCFILMKPASLSFQRCTAILLTEQTNLKWLQKWGNLANRVFRANKVDLASQFWLQTIQP